MELPLAGDVSGQESVTINILENSLFDVMEMLFLQIKLTIRYAWEILKNQ